MKGFIVLFILVAGYCFCSFGQGTVRGKITDDNGEPVIGATVVLKSNRTIGTSTDLDGSFSLKIPDTTTQVLIISFISFNTMEEVIHPFNHGILIRNFILTPSSKGIKEVQITAKAVKGKEYYMEKVKQNSATTMDYISSESMKKTGDANIATAVTRVSGVARYGEFYTVRGIGDRYVKTAINGSVIPTLDPFTNNIKLDLFPSSLVDNIIITKTANPDLPGDWAGAYLSIETKDYPDQLAVNAETSVGYNNQSSFKEVITSDRSSTDWLGYDGGLRSHNHDEPFANAVLTPTRYQEFVALGLGSYYNSLGVTNYTPWNDTYYKLGLVQLGLLAPAQFNDDNAFTDAKAHYVAGFYQKQAFSLINTDVPTTSKSFADNWGVTYKQLPLSFSQSFSIGNQTRLLGKQLGYLFGFRYGNSVYYDPNSIANRENNVLAINSAQVQKVSKETNGWSAVLNLAYKLTPNHSISLLFMPNLTGGNRAAYIRDAGDIKTTVLTQAQFYEQRRQLIYQLKTEHYLKPVKLEMNASYTKGNSTAPDFKYAQYWQNADSTYQVGGSIGDGLKRYYRYLDDNVLDSRLAAEIPFSSDKDLVKKIKGGVSYLSDDKKFDQYTYSIQTPNSLRMTNPDLDQLLALNNFDIRSFTDAFGQDHSTLDLYYLKSHSPADHTFGKSEIKSAFVMLDYSLNQRIRFSGGLRVEKADMFTDAYLYDSLHLASNDPRRQPQPGDPIINPGKLNATNYLPSANLIYKVRNNELSPMNLRINYSRTTARPSLRELSDIGIFDFEMRAPVYGNSTLKTVDIDNYDIRLENYFKKGEYVSASFFYKNFKNSIELLHSNGFTWINADKTQVGGLELEGHKGIGRYFDLGANVCVVKSETNFVRPRVEQGNSGERAFIPQDTSSHPMYGQAPYIINTIATYKNDSLGLTVSLSYNVQGPRLSFVSDNKEIPDVYELPRHLLDLKVTKSISKHFSTSVTARDILNSPITRSYKNPDGYTLIYDRYTWGTTYVLAITYKL